MSDEFLGGPWSVMPELRIRARDPKALVIMLSISEGDALLLANGLVSQHVREQAKDCCDWNATEFRIPEHERKQIQKYLKEQATEARVAPRSPASEMGIYRDDLLGAVTAAERTE